MSRTLRPLAALAMVALIADQRGLWLERICRDRQHRHQQHRHHQQRR